MEDTMERYADELKERWGQLEDTDKLAIGGAGILTLAGVVISLFTRSAVPFLGGAAGGALLVGARIITKQDAKPQQQQESQPVRPSKAAQNDRLGAPAVSMQYAGPVQTFNGLVSEEEARNFPLMHRIPEADIRTDPLNESIAPTPDAPHAAQSVTDFW